MGYMRTSMRGLIFMSLTTIRTLWTRPFLRRMPWQRPKRIGRGRPNSPMLVGQTRSSVLSKRVLRVLPSHLQLDTGGWPRLRTSRLGISSIVRHNSSPTILVHPQPTTTMLLRTVATIIVGSRDTTSVSAPNPSKTSKVKAQGPVRAIKIRNPWCKSSRANWTSPPWWTFQRERQC
jgi:hypothetical protein